MTVALTGRAAGEMPFHFLIRACSTLLPDPLILNISRIKTNNQPIKTTNSG